jgi:hypothetical protein
MTWNEHILYAKAKPEKKMNILKYLSHRMVVLSTILHTMKTRMDQRHRRSSGNLNQFETEE